MEPALTAAVEVVALDSGIHQWRDGRGRPRVIRVASLLLACLGFGACTNGSARPVDAGADVIHVATNALDIVFVLPKGSSTEPQCTDLISHFPDFLAALEQAPLPPDLHVGILSSYLGAGAYDLPECTAGGAHGLLENTPNGIECSTSFLRDPNDRFLVQSRQPDGSVQTNFGGNLAEAFACYAELPQHCGVEHFLGVVRAAFDGCNTASGCAQPANAGFLRPDAVLAVVMLGDYDDCSLSPDSTLFDPSQTTLNSELGPLSVYRCFEFGTLCNGADPGRAVGPRENCVPGSKDADPHHQLIPVEELAGFFKGLKRESRKVYVGIIAAPPAPVAVHLDGNGFPRVTTLPCGDLPTMFPGIRLAAFANQFDPDRGRFFSCDEDLATSMTQIGTDLAAMLGR